MSKAKAYLVKGRVSGFSPIRGVRGVRRAMAKHRAKRPIDLL